MIAENGEVIVAKMVWQMSIDRHNEGNFVSFVDLIIEKSSQSLHESTCKLDLHYYS